VTLSGETYDVISANDIGIYPIAYYLIGNYLSFTSFELFGKTMWTFNNDEDWSRRPSWWLL